MAGKSFICSTSSMRRDLNGTMPEPRLVSDVPLKMNVSGKVNKIWVASPDFHAGASQELSFEQKDGTVTFTLPLLKYWSMLVME
jgi:dextranase